ncbi:hypothetical protein EDC01DRAFT_638275 [Geopyxis carbonaria]|nr:hypothetical protein EDC01DRAFT_638275 [Geopyxis carbonaria]
MPTLRGVRCEVLIEGTPVAEYDVHVNPKDGTASCHVVAESDKQFAIRLVWDTPKPNQYLSVRTLDIDGEQQQSGFREQFTENITLDGFKQRLPDRKRVKRPWKFASLDFAEEESNDVMAMETLEALGSIQIQLALREKYGIGLNYVSAPTKYTCRDPVPKPVREKDIKGRPLSHQVNYGAEQVELRKPKKSTIRRSNMLDRYYCRFSIYYRSKANLQSLGMIPDSDEEAVAAMTPEEMQAELLRLRRMANSGAETSARAVKRERDDDDCDGAQKRRRSAGGNQRSREVIDMTLE